MVSIRFTVVPANRFRVIVETASWRLAELSMALACLQAAQRDNEAMQEVGDGGAMKTDLITVAGRQKLQDEYDFLWTKERPKTVNEMAAAALDGDRSDNAPYQYARHRLREIDSRLRFLGNRLKALKIGHTLANPKHVNFGCWVTYEDENGTEHVWQLVGPDEFDIASNKISIDSPVGQALLGKRVDDEVVIRRPAGDISATITAISSSRPG